MCILCNHHKTNKEPKFGKRLSTELILGANVMNPITPPPNDMDSDTDNDDIVTPSNIHHTILKHRVSDQPISPSSITEKDGCSENHHISKHYQDQHVTLSPVSYSNANSNSSNSSSTNLSLSENVNINIDRTGLEALSPGRAPIKNGNPTYDQTFF